MGATSRTIKITGLLATAGLAAAGTAFSQEGGLTFAGRLAQTFEFSDNPDFTDDATGTTLRSRTDLTFGFDSVTSEQSLGIDFGAGLRYTLTTSDDSPVREGLTDPFFRIDYSRNSATALITLNGSFSQSDVGDLRFVLDPDVGDLVVDDGKVDRTTLGFGLDTGIGAPFGVSLDAFYSRRVYTDTTDPDLTDDEFFDISGAARFRVTPTTSASLIASYSRDQELEGAIFDRRTTRLGFGFDHELSETRRVSFDLTGDQIDTTDTLGSRSEEGYSFGLGYAQDLPNGGFAIDASSTLESIGNRNTLSFSRNIDLPDGEIEVLAGVTNNDTSDLSPIFRLGYSRDLRDGEISARVEQNVRQSRRDDDEFRNRILSLAYSQEINSVSGWRTSLGYAESDNLTDGSRERRTDFLISYRRDLTQDWDIVSGYRFEQSRSNSDPDREANTVFLTIERTFDARP